MAEATPKIFGRITLGATTPADVFSSPATGAAFSVRLTNNDAANPALVKVSISTTTATIDAVGRLVADNTVIPTLGTLELTGLTIASGFFLVVESNVATEVNAIAYGMEL